MTSDEPTKDRCTPQPYIGVEYLDLLEGIRRIVDARGVTFESVEAVAGLAKGQVAKLLSFPPARHFGEATLGPLLETLDAEIVIRPRAPSNQAVLARLTPRKRPPVNWKSRPQDNGRQERRRRSNKKRERR